MTKSKVGEIRLGLLEKLDFVDTFVLRLCILELPSAILGP